MSDKPKKWTWGEWKRMQREVPRFDFFASKAFQANEPYIDYLEKRVKELEEYCEELDYYIPKLGQKIKESKR